MRVLHVISAIDTIRGGPIVALLGMAEAQKNAGLDVQVAATWIDGESPAAAESLRKLGIEVAHIGPCRGALRRHPAIEPELHRLISGSDVVHVHALYEEIQHQAARLARARGVPYLFRPCGMLTPWSLAQHRLKKRAYMLWRLRRDLNGAAAIHYTTRAERDVAVPLRLRPPAIVEPLGVNLDEFGTLPPRGRFRERHPEFAGRKIVLFVGRIHPGKGLELLVPALARANVPDAALVIVGPDSENFKATIDRAVIEAGLVTRVCFTGMLRGAERLAAMADADLFALPSFHENFGIAVIEALAAGLPVIVSDEVNVCREIEQAQVGGVVPTQVEPLAMELNRWLTDDSLRAAAAARARPFVEQHYDWDRISRRWVEHYNALTVGRLATPLSAAG